MATEGKLALVREIIKCARESKEMTRSEVAKKIGVTYQTINFWESGATKRISKVHRCAVAKALGIDENLVSYRYDTTLLQRNYLAKHKPPKENFDLQPLPDLLVVTDNGPNRTYHSSGSAPDVMGYINSLQERVQALEDKLQRIEKAFKGDKEDGNH